MPNLKQLENIYTLLSHRKYYGTPRTPDEILGSTVSLETLSQLSILSYSSSEERRFRKWAKSNLPSLANPSSSFDDKHTYGRAQLLECWKIILITANRPHAPIEKSVCSLSILHELLLHINDYSASEGTHQYLIKSAILHSRDDFKYKLYRAHKIFACGKSIARHVQIFQEKFGFKIEDYINIIYMIIVRYVTKRNIENFEIAPFSKWKIDLLEASQETGIDLQLLISVMKSISFNLTEGAEFSQSTFDDQSNHCLFRDKPFLRLSDTEYLPIEGKFIEELLFDNLFHKVHSASGKAKEFLDYFGADFERYVQNLCKDACTLEQTGLYEFIPEFKYGKPQAKSPDAMILCPSRKTLLALEVKASRYLDSILSSNKSEDAIEKSFNNLRYRPWKQVHTSICRIVLEKRHPKIIDGLSCLFISVTMNEIPLSLEDHKITINDRDISYCFYSLGIHTLELLLSGAVVQNDYTLYDLLRNAYDKRHNISTKTCLLRFYRYQGNLSALDLAVAEFVTQKHRKYILSFQKT